MGPLRGDGSVVVKVFESNFFLGREDGSPSWGRKRLFSFLDIIFNSREDGSPSWGRKL